MKSKKQRHEDDRIVFYSINDGSCVEYLTKIEVFFKNFDKSSSSYDINDIIEFDQIKKYIDSNLFLKKWTQEDIELFKSLVSEFKNIIGKFLASINDKNIIKYHEQLIFDYYSEFWRLIDEQKVYKRISKEIFGTLISNYDVWINEILKHKNLVSYYKQPLHAYLLNNLNTAELLLSEYVEQSENKSKLYFPENLTISEKETILVNYLDQEDTNLNYVRLILNIKNDLHLSISDKTRLKAKKEVQKGNERILQNGNCIEVGVSVTFSEKQSEIKRAEKKGLSLEIGYSFNYIKKYKDFKTLFRNFIFLFEFLDEHLRINLLSKEQDMGVFKYFGLQSKNTYPQNHIFRQKTQISQTQTIIYHKVLKKIGLNLEDIISKYVNEYLPLQYNIKNLHLLLTTDETSYLGKVRMIIPELESLLKQYKLFITENEIDHELLQISSSPCPLKEIPSLLKKKYLYLNEKSSDAKTIQYYFFSDQAMLSYIEPFKGKYECLFDLLINEDVHIEQFKNFQIDRINYLIEAGYLYLNKKSLLDINNIKRVCIFKDLYENEFGSYGHYPKSFQTVADQMENEQLIYFGNTLLSKPEQSYFNFHLNKSEFTNSLDLRNNYMHGTQGNYDKEEKHENVYYMFIKLLILAIFKIEDDLMLAEQK